MRILMTADAAGGVWTYVMDLAAALHPLGYEVHLACLGPALSREQSHLAESRCHHLHEGDFRLEWMEDPWADVERSGQWLLDLERRVRPDVVHLNGFSHGRLPWRAPALVVGHSCVTSWFEAVRGEPAPPAWDRYRREVRQGLQKAQAVVAPTQAMLDALQRHHGPLPHGRVIRNGRPAGRFQPGRKEPLIVSAGRLWDEAKNVAILDAVADGVAWPIVVAGDTRAPDGGEVPLRRVRALGRLGQDELGEWLAAASIYAHPARYEPFGLTPLEAAQAGCALVLGDIPTLREVWGEAAHYVNPADSRSVRDGLNLVAGDPALRRDLAHRARERAAELTARRMAAGYDELYESLARAHARLAG